MSTKAMCGNPQHDDDARSHHTTPRSCTPHHTAGMDLPCTRNTRPLVTNLAHRRDVWQLFQRFQSDGLLGVNGPDDAALTSATTTTAHNKQHSAQHSAVDYR